MTIQARPRSSTNGHVAWPPERFYWAVLDTSILPDRSRWRRSREQYEYLLEPFLPIPIGDVHAVYEPIDDDRVLACAVERRTLDGEIPAGAVTLSPSGAPPVTFDVGGDADRVGETLTAIAGRMNLLIGPYAPAPIRRTRTRLRRTMLALLTLVFAFILLGLERRIRAADEQQSALATAIRDVQASVLGAQVSPSGGGGGGSSGGGSPEIRMLAELRRLERTRSAQGDMEAIALVDGIAILENVLASWPDGVHVTTEMLTVTPTAVTVRFDVPTEEVEQAIGGLQPWEGWTRRQPEIVNREGVSTVTVRFVRGSEGSRL